MEGLVILSSKPSDTIVISTSNLFFLMFTPVKQKLFGCRTPNSSNFWGLECRLFARGLGCLLMEPSPVSVVVDAVVGSEEPKVRGKTLNYPGYREITIDEGF